MPEHESKNSLVHHNAHVHACKIANVQSGKDLYTYKN